MDELILLNALEMNGRVSVNDLADIVNSSTSDVTDTINKLEKDKVICGFHTVINWDKTSQEKVMAIIEVDAIPVKDMGYDVVAKQIVNYPEVSTLYLMSGKHEFTVIIKGKTMKEVANFVHEKLAPIQGVKATVTSFVLKPYKIEGVMIEDENSELSRLNVAP